MYFDREVVGASREYFKGKQKRRRVEKALAKIRQMSEDLMGGKWKSIPFTAQDTQLQHIVLMAPVDDIHVMCGEKTASSLTIIKPSGYRQSQTDKWSTLRIIIRVTMYRFSYFKDIPCFQFTKRTRLLF